MLIVNQSVEIKQEQFTINNLSKSDDIIVKNKEEVKQLKIDIKNEKDPKKREIISNRISYLEATIPKKTLQARSNSFNRIILLSIVVITIAIIVISIISFLVAS